MKLTQWTAPFRPSMKRYQTPVLAELAASRRDWSWNVTTVPPNSWNESDQKAIRQQLERILHSGPFHQSQRRQRFLEYLVTETLAGRSDRLKGYNIALEVFDRPETFDPTVYPLVRIEAARLREKLREYYDADGQGDPIRIDLPKGKYTPQIEFRQAEALGPKRDRSEVSLENKQVPLEGPVPPVDERPSPLRPRSIRHLRWWAAASALVFILALGAVGAWLARDLWTPALKGVAENQLPTVPKGPAIAVLPFLNLSGDPKQEYFSDGLTVDILTELSRARDLRVIARNTSFQYKDKAVDVTKLGRELNVRYVLEGSVQRSDDRLRVAAQLIDTETGTHIWADRYDREMADVFLVQDEIVNQIVANIAGSYGAIERAEVNSAARKSPEQIRAYDLVLRARGAIQFEWTRFARPKNCCAKPSCSTLPTRKRAVHSLGSAQWAGCFVLMRRRCRKMRPLARRPRLFCSTLATRAREWWRPPHTSSPNGSICSHSKPIRL